MVRIAALIATLLLSQASLAQTLTLDLVEKFVRSSCAVTVPLMTAGTPTEAHYPPDSKLFAPSSNQVEYLRLHAGDSYQELTKIVATFGFESLEEWAAIGDRVSITRLSLTAPPDTYSVRRPPEGVIVLSSNSDATEIYFQIAELITTVTDEERAAARPFLDAMKVDCLGRN